MIEDTTPHAPTGAAPVSATNTPVSATPATPTPHPAFSILAEIETVLRDLESIPSHIADWVKAKLAEAKATL